MGKWNFCCQLKSNLGPALERCAISVLCYLLSFDANKCNALKDAPKDGPTRRSRPLTLKSEVHFTQKAIILCGRKELLEEGLLAALAPCMAETHFMSPLSTRRQPHLHKHKVDRDRTTCISDRNHWHSSVMCHVWDHP